MKFRAPEPIPAVLKCLYAQQKILRTAFPRNMPVRKGLRTKDIDKKNSPVEEHGFALDGNLIGDMGEVIAEKFFGLEKLPGNSHTHDFKRPTDGLRVQVKTTQKAAASKQVGLGLVKKSFDCLLALELDKDGTFEVLYNGPGTIIDKKRGHKKSASLSRKQLRECQMIVDEEHMLRVLPDLKQDPR